MAGPKGSGKLVNCVLCGRDTRAMSQICARCSGDENRFSTREHTGRKLRATQALGGSSIADIEPEEGEGKPSTLEQYHGKTVRDDL